METKCFVIGDGPVYGFMAAELSRRLQLLNNGLNVTLLTDGICKGFGIQGNRQYWMKAFLWQLTPARYDRIIYVDADILPVKPLPAYIHELTAPFSARLDCQKTAVKEKASHAIFKSIKQYFNNGFFVATRASIPMFDKLQKELDNPIHGNCIEQTWMNKYVDETCGLNVIPDNIATMIPFEKAEDAIMRHYASPVRKLDRFMADMELFKI